MKRYVQVIVDVPAKQTNRPFTYEVPPRLQPQATVGSRVKVPFAGRFLQGIIIDGLGEAERPSFDPKKIKPIHDVMDPEPALTEELISLARWMSETYICPLIYSLHAMLPKALKAKYERNLQLDEEQLARLLVLTEEQQRLVAWLRKQNKPTMSACLKQFPGIEHELHSLLEMGALTETAVIADRTARRTTQWITSIANVSELQQALEQTRANARQQLLALEVLQVTEVPIELSEFCARSGVSAGTVRVMAGRSLLSLDERETYRDPYAEKQFAATSPLQLTAEQMDAFAPVHDMLKRSTFGTFLLHGVTGSGKTELYLQWIEACIELSRQAIVLVPEISLTPQMVDRFKGRFGRRVAVLHSRMSDGERYDEWRKIRRGEVDVAVGARSAVFAPFSRVGLIVIDEEHETSYKQEDTPRYHAREVARRRCEESQAVLVLGSATPSLESYHAAQIEETILRMASRATNAALPAVSIVDMREELRAGNRSFFSLQLQDAIRERLDRREQTILFLNRRGYSTAAMCRDCGRASECPHCSISLTFHKNRNVTSGQSMRCHYCGYQRSVDTHCSSCGSVQISFFGTGTQRVEESLVEMFPGLRVIRMDVDTTATKGAHERLLGSFARGEADLLLGTQMISKGLDFPDVTLVGVITADTMLHMPDFRAAERTFQLLTQVAGRAGRAQKPGQVIVQTYNPDHYSVRLAADHNYSDFAFRELQFRATLEYPPFCRLLLFNLSHEDSLLIVRAAEQLAAYVRECSGPPSAPFFTVLGPVPAAIEKIKDRYRYQCVVKYKTLQPIQQMLKHVAQHMQSWTQTHKLQIQIDVDPQMMM